MPEWWVNKACFECAQDSVDGLVALGLLKLDADPSDAAAPEDALRNGEAG
jgi:hypothetical protein